MKKYKEVLEAVFLSGLVCGFSTFALNFMTVSYWKSDGFDFLEIAFITIIAGLYMFISILPSNIYFLNKGIKDAIESESMLINRTIQVLLSLVVAMLIFLLLDLLLFTLDDSIPQTYANMLKEMAESNGDDLPGFEGFAKLPLGIQNAILTFTIGLIGALVSLIFIKKDGILF